MRNGLKYHLNENRQRAVCTLGSNLLSIKKLVKEGYKLIFEGDECTIVKNENLQTTAKLFSDLFGLKTAERAYAVSSVGNSGHTEFYQHA